MKRIPLLFLNVFLLNELKFYSIFSSCYREDSEIII